MEYQNSGPSGTLKARNRKLKINLPELLDTGD